MNRLLRARLTSVAVDRWFAWVVACLLLAACTTLTLKALPSLDLARSFLLVGSNAAGWLALACLRPW